jgi:hypothetical protein
MKPPKPKKSKEKPTNLKPEPSKFKTPAWSRIIIP